MREEMGCASAKQVSAVPSDDEGRGKAYSNGDVYSGQSLSVLLSHAHTAIVLRFHATFASRCETQLSIAPILQHAKKKKFAS